MTQYPGDFTWKPLLRKSETIRNLSFGTSLDYYGGSGSGKVETRAQDVNLGIQSMGGGLTLRPNYHASLELNFREQ